MHSELHTFLSKFTVLSKSEADEIAAQLHVEEYKKGTVLLKAGEISGMCYFILKGCVRQYSIIDGEEKTTAFYTEEQAVASFISYTQGIPADHSFVCTEDTLAIAGDMSKEQDMFEKFPKLQQITRTMMEQNMGKIQQDFTVFMTSSPEERYLNLLKTRPDLLNRVPQHQIASYLGVTPESLSRIRKRIFIKD